MGWPRPVIRPATAADLAKFYPRGSFKATARAMVGLVRGRIVGCGGVAYIDGRLIAFADFKPSARRYKVSIVKAAIGIITEVQKTERFIYATADPDEPGAKRWILSLGFEPTAKPDIFRWAAK